MNNQELELRIKEILANENFFDMMTAVFAFDKEYKGSEFYKVTKMPLCEVIEKSKIWYAIQPTEIKTAIQGIINGLDISNLYNLIEKMGSVFSEENAEIMNEIRELNLENFWK